MPEISKILKNLHKPSISSKALPINQKQGFCKKKRYKISKYNSPYTIPQTSSIPLVV